VRGRALLFAFSIAAGIANYAFGLICVHRLGARSYADIAAVTSISMILTVPLTGLQAAYGRDVAMASGRQDQGMLAALRRFGRIHAIRLQMGLLALSALLVPVLVFAGIGTPRVLFVLPFLTLGTTAVPIMSGFLQGLESYSSLAVVTGIGGIVKLAVTPIGIVLAGAVGAVSAVVVGNLVTAVIALHLVRRETSELRSHRSQESYGPSTTRLSTIALVAYGVISNVDLVLASALLTNVGSGNYAAATIAGRGMAFVASTVSILLLTSTSRRISQGLDTWVPLQRTMVMVAGLGAALAMICSVIPNAIYASVFGTTGSVNVLVAVSVLGLTAAGLVNNLLSYALAHQMRWFVVVVVGAAIAFPLVAMTVVSTGLQLAIVLLATSTSCIVTFFIKVRRAPDRVELDARIPAR
jgi:O-antigen/teichoic acid export membrane protein